MNGLGNKKNTCFCVDQTKTKRGNKYLHAIYRDILLGNRRGKSVRFNPAQEVNPSDLENGQILQLQQRLIEGE